MRYPVMKTLPLMIVGSMLVGCAGLGEQAPRSERAQTRLTRALEGKVAGEPRRCLPRYRSVDQEIVDRNTILYRQGRDLVFRNDPVGGCNGLDRTRTLLITPVNGGEYCSGDIVRILDQQTGLNVGSCAFSDFVPYHRPGSRADPSRPQG